MHSVSSPRKSGEKKKSGSRELRDSIRRKRALVQWIRCSGQHTTHVVYGSRIGTSSLCKGGFFRAPSMQQPREPKVSFDAARLVINSVLLVALFGELLLH